ncbi:MAG: GerMN domain-containing protein [Bacillota bacterium]
MNFKKRLEEFTGKRKIFAVLIILVLTAAVIYSIIFLNSNFFGEEDIIKVFFSTEDAMYLKSETRDIDQEMDPYMQTIEELKSGPEDDSLRTTIPEGVELIEYKIKDKNITLNFNDELRENHWGGSAGETLTVYSIVNSYTFFEEIDSVTIILEGEEIDSLVGHLDLTGPLMYNQKLVMEE